MSFKKWGWETELSMCASICVLACVYSNDNKRIKFSLKYIVFIYTKTFKLYKFTSGNLYNSIRKLTFVSNKSQFDVQFRLQISMNNINVQKWADAVYRYLPHRCGHDIYQTSYVLKTYTELIWIFVPSILLFGFLLP